MERVVTHSETETAAQGEKFAARLARGDVIAVYGELGSGKTHLIQGICRGLGVKDHVVSPTFTIVNEYAAGGRSIYHFDFYRVNSLREIVDLGFEEYIDGEGICLIEWADKAAPLLPPRRYEITLAPGDDVNSRLIAITPPQKEGA
jgi:tRNA threonylcarbamoyladenosine biosynthesis protein TsaE